jgi:threonine synthase
LVGVPVTDDWGFVNVNQRPYYAEGSKTVGFEIAEQLGWRLPQQVVIPVASGARLTKIDKGFREFVELGLVDDSPYRVFGAQATGCSPVAQAFRAGHDVVRPVKPDTIAKSLAIGNPADGYYAYQVVTESGGWGESATDREIVDAIKLLARTEGIFTEPAGGTTLACAIKLIQSGRIPRDESIVVSITGNGLKTIETLNGSLPESEPIGASSSPAMPLVSAPVISTRTSTFPARS